MSVSSFDQFDALVILSAKSFINLEAENFLQIEITNSPSPEFSKKIEHLIHRSIKKKRNHPLYKTIKVVAIACLIALSILFTACVSISDIREAMWKYVMEWYDDHIAVRFLPVEDPIEKETEVPTTETFTESPKKIETINTPTKIPYGYMIMSYTASINFYQEYYDENSEFVFSFSQDLKGIKRKVDNLETTVLQIEINGHEALLIIGKENIMSLLWEDEYYSYAINGLFSTQEEIINIAKSVKKIK